MTRTIAHTNCHFCGYLCALQATVDQGRIVDIAPDPTRYPYDAALMRRCRRWPLNLAAIESPDRINYPLHRTGARGEGAWERITWDEALEGISDKLHELIAESGPETLATAIGGPHTSFWPLHRFMNLLGSPNNMGIGQICWNPRIWMDVVTFGWTLEADLDPVHTGALVMWGTNPAQSDNSAFWHSLVEFSKSDIPLVVIDPRYTQTAARADVWLAPRPATDCTLALGLINVIISEDIYDHAFVETWCHGFDELADQAAAYPPEKVAQVCGVPAADIVRVARIFATADAAVLISGRGIDQVGAAVAPTHRALACLRAITGNVDKPGACALTEASDFVSEVELEMSGSLSDTARSKCLNTSFTPLQSYAGYDRVRALTEKLGRTLPARYMTSAHPDLVLKAMMTGEPYPVRALIVQATNPLLTYADTHRVFEALSSLDLVVVLEYSMTPTAAMADYVLPAAGAMERPVLQAHGGVANIAYGGPAAVEPAFERRCDYDFFRALGLRFGQKQFWPQVTLEEAFAAALEPAAMTWEHFCQTGLYFRPPAFGKHEALDARGLPVGFATKTGKVELASELLDELGGQRVPAPIVRKVSVSPAIARKGHVLTMITGARKQPYNASVFFDNADFRAKYPDPVAEMNAKTAEKLGLVEGDRVVVATDKGCARFILKIALMRDEMISVDYGWWFPENDPSTPESGGIWRSNVNVLTDCSLEAAEPMIGTWSYNAIECAVWLSNRALPHPCMASDSVNEGENYGNEKTGVTPLQQTSYSRSGEDAFNHSAGWIAE
ncbi:MAG: molybdopterin-dependent oxidoreductase [Raoultibacter sp.]